MISKQFSLEGKVIVPVLLKNATGKPLISGTFYVYEDEKLARQHLKEAVFKRLEKAKVAGAKQEETAQTEAKPAEEKPKEESK